MDGHLFNPDDDKQPKTFVLNISYFFNLLALYIEYVVDGIQTQICQHGVPERKGPQQHFFLHREEEYQRFLHS